SAVPWPRLDPRAARRDGLECRDPQGIAGRRGRQFIGAASRGGGERPETAMEELKIPDLLKRLLAMADEPYAFDLEVLKREFLETGKQAIRMMFIHLYFNAAAQCDFRDEEVHETDLPAMILFEEFPLLAT